ncbi:major capsid protein [Capybara microvirus Cap1_SP_84]|nr:major capsid protein [Capybara microvirus Cap1_SP_84]
MANPFDKLQIKSAVNGRSRVDLSRPWLGTLDFGQIVPLVADEVLGSDSLPYNITSFTRMTPLALPTYGKFMQEAIAVFVPWYQVWDDWKAFQTGLKVYQSHSVKQPVITADTFYRLFVFNSGRFATAKPLDESELSGSSYDLLIYNVENDEYDAYTFTSEGRYFYKIMLCLKYNFLTGVRQEGGYWYLPNGTDLRDVKFNALPLLAYFKAYNDFMSQSQKYNNSYLTRILNVFRYRTSWTSPTGEEVSLSSIMGMFDELKLQYKSDYFTKAWKSPVTALGDVASLGQTVKYTDDGSNTAELVGSDVRQDISATHSLSGGSSRYIHAVLSAFNKWFNRNQYVGSKALEQVRARFGYKPKSYDTEFAHLISFKSSPMQIGDVTSTADTSTGKLGEYAGKGIGTFNFKFSVNSEKEEGMLIVLTWITVQPLYPFGIGRLNLKIEPLDFYNPEFDGVGVNAIRHMEVFNDPRINPTLVEQSFGDDSIFGFTENYNEYREADSRAVVCGDMALPLTHVSAKYWHMARLGLSELYKTAGVFNAQNPNFVNFEGDEYNRIFQVTDNNHDDHFFISAWVECKATRSIRSLNSVADLGNGDIQVSRNGLDID